MLFKKRRPTQQNEAELTPWEAYQQQAAARKASARKSHSTLAPKLPQLKRLRQRRLFWTLTGIVTFCLLSVAILLYGLMPISRIGQISVSGVETIGNQEIITASGIKRDDRVITTVWGKNRIIRRVKHDLPKIQSVQLKVENINQLHFIVKEYPTVGWLITKQGYHSILYNGTILKAAVQKPIGNEPIFSHFSTGGYMQQMLKVYNRFPAKIKNAISEVQYGRSKENPYQVKLYMNDGNEIIADLRTIQKKIDYYPAMAAQLKDKGVIDLEVGAFATKFSDK